MLSIPKRKFELGQSSLEICQIVVANHPQISHVRVFSHEVSINWRQAYTNEKMRHLPEAFRRTTPLEECWCPRDEFNALAIDDLKTLQGHRVWSVSSKVKCFGTEDFYSEYYLHLPMMNFHLEEDAVERDMLKAIEHICPSRDGVIVESGRYYHYYGDFLLDEEEWYKFLGEFLMPCILVSPRYIGHALNDGYCSLRLTADTIYKPKIPAVVMVL